MHCVYVLKNLKSKKLCIGLTDDFDQEFKDNPNAILISMKVFNERKEAGKHEKYLKSEKGLKELKSKIKRRSLGMGE